MGEEGKKRIADLQSRFHAVNGYKKQIHKSVHGLRVYL